MKKSLVAYFSASGVTKGLADRLAKAIHADLFEIEPAALYTEADLNWKDSHSRSSVEMKDRSSRPEIRTKMTHMDQYEVVFVGFPIWWYREPSIIDTFRESYDFDGKIVIPFATSGGSGLGDSAKNLAALAPHAHIREGQLFSPAALEEELAVWANKWL